jgi:hypothetical protein
MTEFSFTCSCCGSVHEGVPDVGFDAPAYYHGLTEQARAEARLTSETCVIGDDRFIRTMLYLPRGRDERAFGLGVWVTLSHANFERYVATMNDPQPEQAAPWFGWLSNNVTGYPDALRLKTNVHLRPYPERPMITLEPTDHPLARDHRDGISDERLRAVVERALHPDSAA